MHSKFCKGEALPRTAEFDATNALENDDPDDVQEQLRGEEAGETFSSPDMAKKKQKFCKGTNIVKKSGLREGQRRGQYTLYFKYQVAMQFQSYQERQFDNPLERTSTIFNGLSVSNIWRWHTQLEELKRRLLHDTADVQHKSVRAGKMISFQSSAARRMSLHCGRQAAYAAVEEELFSRFKSERSRGRRINERWFRVMMVSLVTKHYGEEPGSRFKATHGWLIKFAQRYGITLRRANNHKHQSVEMRIAKIKRFHARLRRRLMDAPPHRLHPKWGRWLPQNRLSVDQVPCNFREGAKATYDVIGVDRVWIAGSKADDGKRFCTLQIIARAHNGEEGQPRRGQPKIGLIFRGTGCRISQEEKNGWHPDVHVRFQPKAWADADYCEAHAGKEMVEATARARARNEESVAFYDNLHGQTTELHETILKQKAGCVRHLLPTGVTSEIQLIDDGIGYAVKNEMGYALDVWLSKDENLELWTSASFPMWKKRVLITRLAAEAWEKVCSRFDFEKAATRIGMLMTIDGTNDEQIQIQGVEHYSFRDADAGATANDLPDDGRDPEEETFLNSEISDQQEDDEEAVEDGGALGSGESADEDDTDVYVTSVGEAPPPPSGFRCAARTLSPTFCFLTTCFVVRAQICSRCTSCCN